MSIRLEEEVQRLQEELQQAQQRLLVMAAQLDRLSRVSINVSADLVVMCEANLVGDVVLVISKVEQFTQAYKRNRKPVGSVH